MRPGEVKPALTTTNIVAHHRVFWSDESCRWASSPSGSAIETSSRWRGVRRGRPLTFELIAPAERIDRITLHCAIRGQPGQSGLWCELLDQDGTIIARGRIASDEIVAMDSHPTAIDGSEIRLRPGAKYLVRLSSDDGTRWDCIDVRVASAPPGRQGIRHDFAGFVNRRTFFYRTLSSPTSASLPSLNIVALCDSSRSMGGAVDALRQRLPGNAITLFDQSDYVSQWSLIAKADCVIFVDIFAPLGVGAQSFDALCFELHRRGTLTLFFQSSNDPDLMLDPLLSYAGQLIGDQNARRTQRRRCHFAFSDGPNPSLARSTDDQVWPLGEGGCIDLETLQGMRRDITARRMPRVAVVSVLYNKTDIIESFLDHIVQQSYPGEITVVLVNDRSPASDARFAREYSDILTSVASKDRNIIVIDNAENVGNCASRNAGLAAADADIYIVIDCDCLINRDFVSAHVFEHWFEDVDAVIGPLNIETMGRDGPRLVRDLEASPERIAAETDLQDPVQADGFLNCITRNFSVKRRAVVQPMFDLDFSYSTKAGSGFGWEDVEMGYRLYANGAVIRFTDLAFSVHCSHESSTPQSAKVVGSTRNFQRLFEKHPELVRIGRRWATETYGRLVDWAAQEGVPASQERLALDAEFSADRLRLEPLLAGYRRGARPLRVLTYRWHVPHQYELYKLPHNFTLVTNIGNGMVDSWQLDQRPMRPNVRMISSDRIDPKDYDVAILHFDENVLAPQLTNGVISPDWGAPFRWFLGLTGLPKVAICHGTTQFVGQYGADPKRKSEFDIHEDERVRLVETLAASKVKVICNSHQARHEWRFRNSEVIWHGFDPQEFPAATLQRDILALRPDFDRPHYRGAWEHTLVEQRLNAGIRIETAQHPGAALEMRHTNAFATRNFRSYVDRIRSFTCYLNTTLRSPMPRSRGEAMMTGVVPVCLRNHDVDRFIDQGINGFYADTPEELADFLNHLFRNRDRAAALAAAARRTATDIFNHDRYLLAWTNVLKEAVG